MENSTLMSTGNQHTQTGTLTTIPTINKHKASTARTLIHRALTLPNTEQGRTNKLEHVKNTLHANNYPL